MFSACNELHLQVDLVSHSMGGLVVQAYMTMYPQHAAKYVNSWTTIGTPFLVRQHANAPLNCFFVQARFKFLPLMLGIISCRI